MDKDQMRGWLNALTAEEFGGLVARVGPISGMAAFAIALRMKRSEQTDSLLAFYAASPRELLALLSMRTLATLREMRSLPRPLKARQLGLREKNALEELRLAGLSHRGRSGYLVADLVWELCDLTPAEEAEILETDRLLALSRGTLLLTGMLPIQTLQTFVGLPDGRWAEERLSRVLVQRASPSRFAMTPRGMWIVSEYLADPVGFFRQVTRPELSETPRAVFTAQQALQAHYATLPVLLPDAMPVLRAVADSGGNPDLLGRELLFLAQNAPAEEVCAFWREHHAELADTPLTKQLPELLRAVPLWRCLGHSEREIGRLKLPKRRLN